MDTASIQVILFDVGGVLVELTGVPQMLAWTQNRFSENELWRRWLGSPAVRQFETGRLAPMEFAHEMVREYDLPVGPAEFLDAFRSWPTGLYPGVEELLGELRPHYLLASFSNTNELHWPRVIQEMELGGLLDRHFPSHEIGRLKPDVEAFLHVARALEHAPKQILFLDDNAINVEAAQRAGMQARQVTGIHGIRGMLTGPR